MSKKHKLLSEEDRILWEKVKRTIRQTPTKRANMRHMRENLHGDRQSFETKVINPVHPEKITKPSKSSQKSAMEQRLAVNIDPTQLFSGMGVISSTAKPHASKIKQQPALSQSALNTQSAHNAAVDPATRKRIAKGRMPIDSTFDLHGLTQDQARAALSRFVQLARNRGDRTIIVVTGKGSSPKSEGVLRRMVPLWLRQADFQHHISGFSSAARHHGGDGAFYIRLKKLK